jgi:hypothetical protein
MNSKHPISRKGSKTKYPNPFLIATPINPIPIVTVRIKTEPLIMVTTIPFEPKIVVPETIPFEQDQPHSKPYLDVSSVATQPALIHPNTVIQTHSLTAIHATFAKPALPNHAVTKITKATAIPGMVNEDVVTKPTAHAANIYAPSAAPIPTAHNPALPLDFFPIITPFIANAWEKYLQESNLLSSFSTIPFGIRNGFDMGVYSTPTYTYIPPNHKSALAFPPAVLSHIKTELSFGRYTGPFSHSRLELLIGPFRTSPLGLVPKAGTTDQFRLVQDLSFPRNDPIHSSVNSEIDLDDFRCDWGTFQHVASIVIDASPFTEAATLDVDSAFRQCPILPSQQRNFIIMWENLFYIDHNAPFGATSSGGIFGQIADALMAILRAHNIGPAKNWVDDFLFFRHPTNTDSINENAETRPSFSYNLDTIFSITSDLGWPWKDSKTRPFATNFKYLGFYWNLSNKTVEIPEEKKKRYLSKLEPWIPGNKFTRRDAESILGTLVHCSLVLPTSRCRLSSLSSFAFTPSCLVHTLRRLLCFHTIILYQKTTKSECPIRYKLVARSIVKPVLWHTHLTTTTN